MKTYIFIAIAVSSACASHDSEITTTPSMPHENQYASYTQHIPGALFGAAAASLLWLGKARLNKKRSDFHIKLSDELDEQQQKTKTAVLEKKLAEIKEDLEQAKTQAQTDIAEKEKLTKELYIETRAKNLACAEVKQSKGKIASIQLVLDQTEIRTENEIAKKQTEIKELSDKLKIKDQEATVKDKLITQLREMLDTKNKEFEGVKGKMLEFVPSPNKPATTQPSLLTKQHQVQEQNKKTLGSATRPFTGTPPKKKKQ